MSEGRFEQFIRAELNYFGQRDPNALTLEQIVNASTPGKVAVLVHQELPYRFAARIKHLERLDGLQDLPEVVQLRSIFSESFSELRRIAPPSLEDPHVSDLAPFTEMIYGIRRRHAPVFALLGEVARKVRHEADGRAMLAGEAFQAWADTFILSRISTEMLTSHYVAIVEAELSGKPRGRRSEVGIVDTRCDPGRICEEAAQAVRDSFARPGAAGVKIDVVTNSCVSSKADIKLSYIPKYLFYIVQELLRNSARATKEAAVAAGGGEEEIVLRPISITVGADRKQVAICISDKGGGIPSDSAEQIWSYTFSTSKCRYQEYVHRESPLSGYGMGVPTSKLYASYLGGSLEMMSMPGVGVDAYLFLRRIATKECMDLPSSVSDLP